jgi:hypothetical protein
MEILKHAHSGLRWVVFVLILIAIYNALTKKGKSNFTSADARVNSLTTMFTHIQFILGLILYFISPKVIFAAGWMKDASTRFYGMEHIVMMLLAVVLITIGSAKSKRAQTDEAKFKSTLLFFSMALIVIFAAIPWPFRNLGGGWF